jgi:hypothetical protein
MAGSSSTDRRIQRVRGYRRRLEKNLSLTLEERFVQLTAPQGLSRSARFHDDEAGYRTRA